MGSALPAEEQPAPANPAKKSEGQLALERMLAARNQLMGAALELGKAMVNVRGGTEPAAPVDRPQIANVNGFLPGLGLLVEDFEALSSVVAKYARELGDKF